MGLLSLFKKSPHREAATDVYHAIVRQSRLPIFYQKLAVPDTFEGRFDLILVHAFLVMNRLKADVETTSEFSQELFDVMFKEVKTGLREIGVGDSGMPHRLRKLTSAFNGRIQIYDESIASQDMPKLLDALDRNLYRETKVSKAQLEVVGRYMIDQVKIMSAQPLADIMKGQVTFTDVGRPAEDPEASA